jgi:uncharacterized protein (DUF433 family)
VLQYAHIAIDAADTPFVRGTPFKVIEIALDHLAYGWDAEQIQRQHPQLTLGQIHAALSYYFDHQAALDREIDRRLETVDDLQARIADRALAARLRALRRSR